MLFYFGCNSTVSVLFFFQTDFITDLWHGYNNRSCLLITDLKTHRIDIFFTIQAISYHSFFYSTMYQFQSSVLVNKKQNILTNAKLFYFF